MHTDGDSLTPYWGCWRSQYLLFARHSSSAILKKWAERAQVWETGEGPSKLPLLAPAAPKKKRDVFLFVISGAKERNPAAAQRIIAELK